MTCIGDRRSPTTSCTASDVQPFASRPDITNAWNTSARPIASITKTNAAERRAGAGPWRQPAECSADREHDCAEGGRGRRRDGAARSEKDARHHHEEEIEHGHRRMNAAGDPRALCDDDREPDDEYPAREHGPTGTARHVEDGHETTDRGDRGGAAHERVGFDHHRDRRAAP